MFNSDPAKLRRLIDKCRAAGVDEGNLLAVSLEEFFEGNDDPGSLCCNVTEHPGMPALYAAFAAIRERGHVQDVLVVVQEVTDEQSWPFSSNVYVITAAARDQVGEMVHQSLPEAAWPDSIEPATGTTSPVGLPRPAPGYRVYDLWWD
jgi:hypothetical protein